MENKLNLTKDSEDNLQVVTEQVSPINIEELDAKIVEATANLKNLKATRKALHDFKMSAKRKETIIISETEV